MTIASEQLTEKPASKPKYTDWSYTGMDPKASKQIDFRETSSLPALVVWLTIATNPKYQLPGNQQDQETWLQPCIDDLVKRTGMTPACIKYIRDSMDRKILRRVNGPSQDIEASVVRTAFETVAMAFHYMGAEFAFTLGEGGYVPDNCPSIYALEPLSDAAGQSLP